MDRPCRTWDDVNGPMVEPEPPTWIDDEVRKALTGLSPMARQVMEITGRRVSNRIAADRARFLADWERRQAQAEQNPVRHMRPAVGAIERVPARDPKTHARLTAPRQPTTTRSAA